MLLSRIYKLYYLSSSTRFIKFLRKKGIRIGNNCIFRSPRTAIVDLTRPYMIKIGDRVDMNVNFKIYTHDWSSHVFIGKYGQMINSSGIVEIGNNVYFGADCTVLKGVTIGDNCIIGAGSIVTRSIPSNSVAVGNPCKVICSLDDYYQKRKRLGIIEAKDLVNQYVLVNNRLPKESELREESIYFSGKNDNLPDSFNSIKEFFDYCQEK